MYNQYDGYLRRGLDGRYIKKCTTNMEADMVSLSRGIFHCSVTVYPALTGSKTPTSKFSESEEVRWGINCP
ncbi:hypothetical protein BK710_28725 [Bacillus thuringiensis serovar sumiyoshiensis]|nr:hypothetical protein BK710_28725 [Bacillus thuringiensis serovar sumiyoshiensis]OTW91870.1 hypothetical protein BK711_27035 [Bacillus thuringiensis serovar fukuokaensis]OTZ45263.1 hypothetical protein BK762_25160 [Bacillus thuringiensis serovar toumanoffi]